MCSDLFRTSTRSSFQCHHLLCLLLCTIKLKHAQVHSLLHNTVYRAFALFLLFAVFSSCLTPLYLYDRMLRLQLGVPGHQQARHHNASQGSGHLRCSGRTGPFQPRSFTGCVCKQCKEQRVPVSARLPWKCFSEASKLSVSLSNLTPLRFLNE